jgi:hypothetical protein
LSATRQQLSIWHGTAITVLVGLDPAAAPDSGRLKRASFQTPFCSAVVGSSQTMTNEHQMDAKREPTTAPRTA